MSDRSADTGCQYWAPGDCEGTPHCPPRCPRFVDGADTPLLVRPVTETDREALVAMYDALGADQRTMGLPPVGRSPIGDWLDRLFAEGAGLVAVADPAAVTDATASAIPVTAGDDRLVAGHVALVPAAAAAPEFVVFVRERFQGRDVGDELLRQAIARAAAADRGALSLHVARGNTRARRLYESLGFEETDRDAVTYSMRLPLSAAIAEQARLPPAER